MTNKRPPPNCKNCKTRVMMTSHPPLIILTVLLCICVRVDSFLLHIPSQFSRSIERGRINDDFRQAIFQKLRRNYSPSPLLYQSDDYLSSMSSSLVSSNNITLSPYTVTNYFDSFNQFDQSTSINIPYTSKSKPLNNNNDNEQYLTLEEQVKEGRNRDRGVVEVVEISLWNNHTTRTHRGDVALLYTPSIPHIIGKGARRRTYTVFIYTTFITNNPSHTPLPPPPLLSPR